MEGVILMLIPIAAMAFWIIIIYIIFHFVYRSEKQFHDTLQAMLKNGQQLSPELLAGIPGYVRKKEKDDLRSGLMTAAAGVGIALFGYFGVEVSSIMGIGLLVFCIGAGMLAHGIYMRNKGNG